MHDDTPAAPHPKLNTLGSALLLLGILDLGFAPLMVAVAAFQLLVGPIGVAPPQGTAEYVAGYRAGQFVALVSSFTGIAVGALTLLASRRVAAGTSYRLCLTAVILNMIPCCNTACCGLVGIPVGLWALVVLRDPTVRASLRD